MNKLTIIAHITAQQGHIDLVKTALLKLIDTTRAEEGCINYDVHQDNENPAHFLFHENWQSRALWQKHMNNEHIKDYMQTTENAVESFVLHEMTHLM